MITLSSIKETHHLKTNEMRNIDLVVHGESFEKIWEACSKEQQSALADAIDSRNYNKLLNLMRQFRQVPLAEKSVRELRILARKAGITGFMLLNKASLLSILSKQETL